MVRGMVTWYIYEEITPVIGEKFRDFCGVVSARTKESALNKAKKEFKLDDTGVSSRRRNPENFIAI